MASSEPGQDSGTPGAMAASQGDALPARVRALYEQRGLSTRAIAELLGLGRHRVDRALREAGVTIAPRGAGRARPATRRPDPDGLADQLRELYTRQRLTRRQISEKLAVTEGLVRSRLVDYGIRSRTRGRGSREDRRDVPAEQIIATYRDTGAPAEAAAALLGVSRGLLLRAAHDHGIAVRPSATTRRVTRPIELIAALYDDPSVRCTLERHAVPIVTASGPIWQRFPDPVALSTRLCTDLYVDCGLSTTHIELLTGQASSKVRDVLRRAGVTLRPPGGRSPFRRRWDANHPLPS
jgi:hypothetical protein